MSVINDVRDFHGKVAIVVGGGSGIGAAAAELLRSRGATVVVGDLTPSETTEALDATDEDAVDAFVQSVVDRYGRIDCAANFVGKGGPRAELTQTTTEDYRRQLQMTLDTTFFCTRAELRHMRPRQSGSIVNTSSLAGLVGLHSLSAYCAAKHGVIGLSRSAALEVAAEGIRINIVCPGRTLTSNLEGVLAGNDALRERMINDQPMLRFAKPTEIAEAACFLLSDAASFITGEAFQVDGGEAAHS